MRLATGPCSYAGPLIGIRAISARHRRCRSSQRSVPFSAGLFPGSTCDDVILMEKGATRLHAFLLEPVRHFVSDQVSWRYEKSRPKGYPTDVSDEKWSFAAPYLTLIDVSAPQRKYELRDIFDALRWMARASSPWRMLPNDCPPWELVYQQTQRWLQAGCFEHMVSDLRSVIRVAQGR